MALRRHLSSIRSVIIVVLLSVGLSIYTPISAQEETPPPPPPLPEVIVEVSPTIEPSATSLPSETPTLEPTATDAPPTATLEPTAEPPTETPTLEPTIEPTLESTAEQIVTATPESVASTEEPTAEVTPDIITATPELFITDIPPTPEGFGGRRNSRVAAELLDLHDAVEAGDAAQAQALSAALELGVDPAIQRVHIEVIAADAAEAARLRPLVERLGGAFLIGYDRRMEFEFPITQLEALGRIQGNFVVFRPQEGRPALGTRTTQGVQVTGAAQWHARGYNGAGVRVGVVDLGFTGYASGETAGCVKAISNFSSYTLTALGDHGTNVTEIICDMAPKAEVYLAQAVTVSGLSAAVDWLISQNVNIINMSMRWDANGVGDGTGEVNNIVQRAIDRGILWVNAAGNNNGDTWSGAYFNITSPTDLDPLDLPPGATNEWHDFGGGQVVAELFGSAEFDCVPGSTVFINAILRWNDWNANRTGNAANQDYDLFIFRNSNNGAPGFWEYALLSSIDDQAGLFGGGTAVAPVEEVSGYAACSSQNTRFGVAINRFNPGTTTPDEFLYLMTWSSGPLQFFTQGTSISSPADSRDVLSVAAGEVQASIYGWPFSPNGYPDLALYSSRGPILGSGGDDPVSDPPLYNKPDITGPTNVLTSRDTSFFGTSAASPHVAGFAALVYQYNRTTYDALSGNARAMAVRNDMLNPNLFLRQIPPNSSFYAYCNANPQLCFGQGVLTLDSEFFSFTDARLEHTDGRVIRSGAGWTQQAQIGASGGNYAYTLGTTVPLRDNFAQIEFGVTNATGVQVFFWQRPDLTGNLEVLRNGAPIVPAGTTALNAAVPTLASFTVNTTSYISLDEFTIRPGATANGLSLDYVQILHNDPPIDTFQEDVLSKFGTWSRVLLANTSGGYHAINNQRGAGVQFYTDAAEFTVTYTKRPDGGIMEIWVNGQLCTTCGEINMWSGSTLTSPQAVHYVNGAALTPITGGETYLVQLVNSGRQTPATTNRPYVTIDNIRFPLGGSLLSPTFLEAETGYTGQAGSQFLPMNGVWTNMAQASASGGRIFNTTTAGAEFRFRTTASRLLVYYTGLNTGALLEIWVNGQLCTACGMIDTYRSTTMYRVPYYLSIPGSFGAGPYNVTLRNSGRRSNGATSVLTATMGIDRVDALNGVFQNLNLFNVQGTDLGSFWINERWVAQRQTGAIGTDVYINNSPYGGIWFNTCSADFTLLLGKNPSGGIVRVKIWDTGTSSYDTLAEFNGQFTSTVWRYELNVTVNPASYPACNSTTPYQILVEVNVNTQFGNTLDYGYVDALLVNDNGALFGWGYPPPTPAQLIEFGEPELVEVGAGWATLAQAGARGNDVRRTNVSGNSIQFTINDPDWPTDPQSPRLIFSRAPDGGIAEVFVNGLFQYEISFYSPVTLPQQFMPLTLPSNIEFPAVIELRNVPRRTTGSIGYYMYIDAVIETTEPTGFVAPIIGTGTQNDSANLQLFGATWTRTANPPTTTIYPSGSPANIDTATANSGGVRFILTGSNRFTFVSSTSANRGIAEIWVNGRLCTACGTINTFRAQTFWRVPFLVEIPTSLDADPGAGQLYYVDIRTTNMRSTGATGFGLSADEIIPLNGGALVLNDVTVNEWDAIVNEMTGGNGFNGTFTIVTTAFAYGGSYRRTTVPGDDYSFQLPATNNELVILRNTTSTGGIAEIWIRDTTTIPNDLRLCYECGVMNNYSSYTRYQVPFYFIVPARFGPGPWLVQIENTATRAAGSIGYEMTLDAFIPLP